MFFLIKKKTRDFLPSCNQSRDEVFSARHTHLANFIPDTWHPSLPGSRSSRSLRGPGTRSFPLAAGTRETGRERNAAVTGTCAQ